MPAGRGAVLAGAAGLWGALAACSAKLALGADYLRAGCVAVLGGGEESAAGVCIWLPVMLRAGCGGLVLACNAVMWTFFAKALRHSSSSATATVTSTASNFIASVGLPMALGNPCSEMQQLFAEAFLGKLLFGETHALLWWIGISITLFGLLLLHTASPLPEEQRPSKEKKE